VGERSIFGRGCLLKLEAAGVIMRRHCPFIRGTQLSPVELSIERLTPTMTHDSDSPVPGQLRRLWPGQRHSHPLSNTPPALQTHLRFLDSLPTRTSSFP
jgi:hypothetical protein